MARRAGVDGLEKLILLLVEAALETVPKEILNHPAVIKEARRRRKNPSQLLLDRSYHHWAMKGLHSAEKRGRPDIVHFTLLEALGSPLNLMGFLETYVSTFNGLIIYVNSTVRLPRVYERFKGVFEQLFEKGVIYSESGVELLFFERSTLPQIIEKIKPSVKILLSEKGQPYSQVSFQNLLKTERPLVMVGCFPHGDFFTETKMVADVEVSLFKKPLEAWVAVSRVLCLAEQTVSF